MGVKTRLMMRADLRLDLKDSGALWSDAELNRSIERAVADFNRFLPDEKIYEDSLQFAVTGESVAFPADTSLDAVVADENLQTAAAGSTASLDGQPDMPRPLTATITDPNLSINGMVITINGTDKDDQSLQETFGYIRGDSKTIVGKKYFKNVLRIDFVQLSGGGPGDLLDIGYGLYTDVWVNLANSPIKRASESATNNDDSDAAVVRNTDFYMDYANGRVKAISGEGIDAEDTCTFAYGKSQIGIDLSDLPGLIRVQRVEYPIGQIPQNFAQFDTFGKYVVVTGSGESDEQQQMAEDRQFRVYYDAVHQAPGEYSPGTVPEFLEGTVATMAGAYALYIYALKAEHQTVTDIAAARTALGNATGTHSALALALADVEKYLDNNTVNTGEDAAGRLKQITTDISYLENATIAAAEAMNAALDLVPADITNANAVRAKYIDTVNYVAGGTEPDIKTYLASGDALLNKLAVGGEGQDVPRAYREYAQAVKDSLVAAYEQDRRFYQQNATARTNAAMVYAQEAAQRLSLLRAHIERSAGYVAVANTFAAKAGHYLSQVVSYLQQASQYIGAANSDTALADRFRAEADERRNEVYSVWRDRKQYIGDFTAGSMRQMPDYK